MRFYGYTRGSELPDIENAQGQRQKIEDYCRRAGGGVHGLFNDGPATGKLPIYRREAGEVLMRHLQHGDHVVLARLDRLEDSFRGAVSTLETWLNMGVAVHVLDVGCILEPGAPESKTLIAMLNAFVWYWPAMVGVRTKEAHAKLKREGRRISGHAPYGRRWERRGTMTLAVPDEAELVIVRRAVELYMQGYSFDQIRKYLNYEWKVRNRMGHEFGWTEVRNMILRGAGELARESEQAAEVPGPAAEPGLSCATTAPTSAISAATGRDT